MSHAEEDGPRSRPRKEAPPARLFFGVFTSLQRLFDPVRNALERRFGPLHPKEESPLWPFPTTRTYEPTMGPGPFHRKFFFLSENWPQDKLAQVKLATIEIEEAIQASEAFDLPRVVNIDPGLLNDCRIILATTKDHAHRIYRGDGIWEEITLVFRGGAYQPMAWTYPDFRNPDYHAYFAAIRERHLASLLRSSAPQRPPTPEGPPPP